MNIVNDTVNTNAVIQNQMVEENNESLGSRIGAAVKKIFKAIGKFFATPFVAIKKWFDGRKVAKMEKAEVNNKDKVNTEEKVNTQAGNSATKTKFVARNHVNIRFQNGQRFGNE